MIKVARNSITDHETYEGTRDQFRPVATAARDRRRVRLGEHLTFLFENALTMRFQVQETVWVEKIVREREVVHELDTFNALLGGPGDLPATLHVEIPDPEAKKSRLQAWLPLPGHLYVRLEDGSKVRPLFDPARVGGDALSPVQFLRFPVGGRVPVAVGSDMEGLVLETVLTPDQRAALGADLAN